MFPHPEPPGKNSFKEKYEIDYLISEHSKSSIYRVHSIAKGAPFTCEIFKSSAKYYPDERPSHPRVIQLIDQYSSPELIVVNEYEGDYISLLEYLQKKTLTQHELLNLCVQALSIISDLH